MYWEARKLFENVSKPSKVLQDFVGTDNLLLKMLTNWKNSDFEEEHICSLSLAIRKKLDNF